MTQIAPTKTILDMILQLEEIYRQNGNAPLTCTPDCFNEYPIMIEKNGHSYRIKPDVRK
jgi:hypothetical protein